MCVGVVSRYVYCRSKQRVKKKNKINMKWVEKKSHDVNSSAQNLKNTFLDRGLLFAKLAIISGRQLDKKCRRRSRSDWPLRQKKNKGASYR